MTSIDERLKDHWQKKNAEASASQRHHEEPSTSGGGGPTSGDMNERIAKLEARADSTESSLSRIEAKLDKVADTVGTLPTSNGIWGMVATVIGVGLAISALTFVVADYASRFGPPS